MKRNFIFMVLVALAVVFSAQAAWAAPSSNDWVEYKAAFDEAITLSEAGDQAGAGAALAGAVRILDDKFVMADQADSAAIGRVRAAFGAANQAVSEKNIAEVAVQSEIAEKTTLVFVFTEIERNLAKGNAEEASGWFDMMAVQLKLPADHNLVKEMKTLRTAKPANIKKTKLIGNIATALAGKVAEELDESLALSDPKSAQRDMGEARIKAAEGIGYFRAVEPKIAKKLGVGGAAALGGAVEAVYGAVTEGDFKAASENAEIAEDELEEFAPAKKITGSDFNNGIRDIQAILADVKKAAAAGDTEEAKSLADDGWDAFHAIEPELRRLDAARYVAIEQVFPRLQEHPKSADADKLSKLFGEVADVKRGKQRAARASLNQVVVTSFESWRPFLFALLALLGVYPIYLIVKAFGWAHRAWRNIGIFIILLIVPVFMEAVGRLGVEFKIKALQALSFQVSEYAMLAWGLITLVAFLFAISGLRAFCSQFGIEAFGVKLPPVELILPEKTPVEA